jgi:DNA-binding transcriptional ArsR family regulator
MSSSANLKNANKTVQDQKDLLFAFSDPRALLILHLLHNRGLISVGQISIEIGLSHLEVTHILSKLERSNLVSQNDQGFELTSTAKKRLDFGSISFEYLEGKIIKADPTEVPHALGNSYTIEKLIGRGATSFTFRAKQSGTHINRALKIFIPGIISYDQLDKAIKKRCDFRAEALPGIIEVGQVKIQLPDGTFIIVPCIAFEYIDGAQTFANFLRTQVNPNHKLFERFVERVGGALTAIESCGLSHGDLHEGNILVVHGGSPSVEFWVIDFIGIPSATSQALDVASDMENFRDHLLRAVIIACEQYPGYSARYFLGNRVFRVLQGLIDKTYNSFKDMLAAYNSSTDEIPEDFFDEPKPQPFEWLRVEWIPSSDMLFKLFEPYQLRFDIISRFGNNWISGPRGCGKSHYLRVLAFHPEAIIKAKEDAELNSKLQNIGYDFKKAFGVLFTCRLGEFKMFVPEAINQETFDISTQAYLKHILILKIWNKTLYSLNKGLEKADSHGKTVLECPRDFRGFIRFLEERLGKLSIIESLNPLSVFKQACATCTARENSSISVWHEPARRQSFKLLDERDLNDFFVILRHTFQDLNKARFYILVDDASYGQIHEEMQKILNSLVRSIHSNHCFKITFDKFMYTLDTADGRSLDPNNEGTYIDLGETVSPTQRGKASDLSRYMAKVINLRLGVAGYTTDIETILGKSQSVQEFLSALSLPGARRPSRSEKISSRPPRARAYYAGWNIIWSISHGSIRTLLELIEHIFKVNDVSSNIINVPLKDQDMAVRNYSSLRNKQILMLPGEFEGEPLGQQLQAVMTAIGEMSRQYLEKYETGEEGRWYETISLERNDRRRLSPKAYRIFDELIKNGYLLDDGNTFARAQFGLSRRYDMNKIFAPAFQTTYRVRNHIYVSKGILEELLLNPVEFVNRHKKKLIKLTGPEAPPSEGPLFAEAKDD